MYTRRCRDRAGGDIYGFGEKSRYHPHSVIVMEDFRCGTFFTDMLTSEFEPNLSPLDLIAMVGLSVYQVTSQCHPYT